ncbi:hypothetical protein BC831DRAFT_443877 [Entophlyctis helioformis]|nr:hypothetical protein BC831DRAFT_443877 [Entophlyctis helioformis]
MIKEGATAGSLICSRRSTRRRSWLLHRHHGRNVSPATNHTHEPTNQACTLGASLEASLEASLLLTLPHSRFIRMDASLLRCLCPGSLENCDWLCSGRVATMDPALNNTYLARAITTSTQPPTLCRSCPPSSTLSPRIHKALSFLPTCPVAFISRRTPHTHDEQQLQNHVQWMPQLYHGRTAPYRGKPLVCVTCSRHDLPAWL